MAADGSVITNGVWDELFAETSMFKDGKFVSSDHLQQSCGFRLGGTGVAVNTKYAYVLHQNNVTAVDANAVHNLVARQLRASLSTRAPFAGPSTPLDPCNGSLGTYLVDLGLAGTGTNGLSASAMSLAASDTLVAVSDLFHGKVSIYDSETMTFTRSFAVARPGQVAIDASGNLWIVQSGLDAAHPSKIVHMTSAGAALPGAISDVENPQGIALDPVTSNLLVVDAGKAQQVVRYDVSRATPLRIGTLGRAGGISAGTPGQVASDKLLNPESVGVDGAGNVYVASHSPSTIKAFTRPGALVWEVDGLMPGGGVVADMASDGADLYSSSNHFGMDYAKSRGGEWSWKGYTLDTTRFPQDPRLGTSWDAGQQPLAVRTLGGKKFLFTASYPSTLSNLAVYRLDGETAVPIAYFASHSPGWVPGNEGIPAVPPTSQLSGWMWNDANGDGAFQASELTFSNAHDDHCWGWSVDDNGNVWSACGKSAIRRFAMSLGANGNPTYAYSRMTTVAQPPDFGATDRDAGVNFLHYDAGTDTMYLAGYKSGATGASGDWHCLGNSLVRYDHWTTNRTFAFGIPLDATDLACVTSIDVAGQRVFTAALATKTGGAVAVFDGTSGRALGTLTPGPEVGNAAGWVDITSGVRAFQRANGEYLVFVEDDGFNRALLYRGDMFAAACPVPTPTCDPGYRYNSATCRCVSTCSTPACLCVQAGGYWNGHTCS